MDAFSNVSDLREKVILAPMVRGSELAYRNVVRRYGVKRCYSPMLRADEVVKAYDTLLQVDNVRETLVSHENGILFLNDIMKDPEPLVVQLCGNNPQILSEATNILLTIHASHEYPTILEGIDLNLGCPQSCALTGQFGAFLAEKDPNLAVECVSAMKKAIASWLEANGKSSSPCPRLSCKIRLMDTDSNTISFSKQLVEAGCETLTVHCRKRESKNHGDPNLKIGKLLVESLPIPVVINGGIQSIIDVQNALLQTKASGVMVATGFLSNPRFLLEAKPDPAFLAAEYLESCAIYPPPSPLYIQKHLRWIFRPYLEPKDKSPESYKDWRPRLWTFLVRPYLNSLDQFRQVIALYVKLNNSELPPSLHDQPEPTFKSIRHQSTRVHDTTETQSKKRKIEQ